jgi:hypothetical protein
MATESWLETDENKTLLAICARKAIKGYGIFGIIWGVINIAIGLFLFQHNPVNVGVLALGTVMIASGVYCLTKPNVKAILIEAIVSCLILIWNVGITVYSVSNGAGINPNEIIWPVIAAVVLFKEYLRLQHVADLIAAVTADQIKQATQTCKGILKKKWKKDPSVALVQAGSFLGAGGARLQRMEGKVFFVRGNPLRAFVMPDEALRASFSNLTVKKAKVVVQHPLGKLTISLDRKNTDRVRSWLQPTAPAQPAAAASPA